MACISVGVPFMYSKLKLFDLHIKNKINFNVSMLQTLLIVALIVRLGSCGLLRTPKVYNALITTDQNLTPSRSYPIIQPHIHETGISYGSYPSYSGLPVSAYNSFGHYDPYGYSQFGPSQLDYHGGFVDPVLYPGLIGTHPQQPDNSQERSNPNASSQESDESDSSESSTETGTTSNPSSTDVPSVKSKESTPPTNSPIPLNEFGLPPSLVSLNPYGGYHPNPINLSPYPYSSYPLIYDQYSGYNTNPYLPPFGYYPQAGLDVGNFAQASFGVQRKKQGGKKTSKSAENGSGSAVPVGDLNTTKATSENNRQTPTDVQSADIKNYAKQDKNIPDVPPPPLPSGAKNTEN